MKMKMLSAALVALGSTLLATHAAAEGMLVQSARIISVSNTLFNDSAQFRVGFDGGVGPCAAGRIVVFTLSAAGGNTEVFNRAFNMASTALLAGGFINVWDYGIVPACDHASFIEVSVRP